MRLALVLLALNLSGCCGRLLLGREKPPKAEAVKISHGELPGEWQPTAIEGTQAAWHHSGYGATIGIAASCKGVEDVSLGSLAQQVVIGLPHRVTVSKGTVEVDGRQAEDRVVDGVLDGVPV